LKGNWRGNSIRDYAEERGGACQGKGRDSFCMKTAEGGGGREIAKWSCASRKGTGWKCFFRGGFLSRLRRKDAVSGVSRGRFCERVAFLWRGEGRR